MRSLESAALARAAIGRGRRRGIEEGSEEIHKCVRHLAERLGIDAVAGARPVHFATDEPRLLQHFEVLRDSRLREGKLVHDVAANAGPARREGLEDGETCRVAQRPGGVRQPREVGGEEVGLGLHLIAYRRYTIAQLTCPVKRESASSRLPPASFPPRAFVQRAEELEGNGSPDRTALLPALNLPAAGASSRRGRG